MVESEPVTWRLAPGYLAAGKTNLLVGDEGIGKSLWTIRAAAVITSGEPWGPFTIATEPADVILVATEDGWADTIRPRLEVAGADLDHIYMLCDSPDGVSSAQFPRDMDVLRTMTPALVIVDAWIDTVPGGLDVKNAQKARAAIRPWTQYAADTGAAVLLVTHTNRVESASARDKYGLSGGLRQVARSTLYALEDPDTGALLVGPDKNNLSSKGCVERFDRTPVQRFDLTDSNDGTVPRLDHLGSDGRMMRDVLAALHVEKNEKARGTSKSAEIDAWLTVTLTGAGGRIRSADLEGLAAANGYSLDQLKKARARVGAKAVKTDDGWFAEWTA
jgi:AAA domain